MGEISDKLERESFVEQANCQRAQETHGDFRASVVIVVVQRPSSSRLDPNSPGGMDRTVCFMGVRVDGEEEKKTTKSVIITCMHNFLIFV
jgi:hypothetical protein